MKITLILDNLAGVPPETLAILNSANSFLTAYKPSDYGTILDATNLIQFDSTIWYKLPY